MMVKKLRFILVFMIMIAIGSPVAPIFGAEPPPDGDIFKIVGPTMWAVGICDVNTGTVALRVKKIEDCDVDTDPQSASLSCPTQESDVLYYKLPRGSVFSRCDFDNHQPIITKVKNFKVDVDAVSFDAQINFVVPKGALDGVCE